MRTLSPRESKLVALAILLAAIALVFVLFVNPVLDGFRERDARRAQLVQTFHLNERRIANVPALQHEAERQNETMRALFMAAPDPDQAGEALRDRIETAAQSIGAEVKASESTPVSDDGWAHAAVEARLTHTQLAALLQRLNDVKPALVVTSITVSAQDAMTNFKSDQLDVRIETSAPFVLAR